MLAVLLTRKEKKRKKIHREVLPASSQPAPFRFHGDGSENNNVAVDMTEPSGKAEMVGQCVQNFQSFRKSFLSIARLLFMSSSF